MQSFEHDLTFITFWYLTYQSWERLGGVSEALEHHNIHPNKDIKELSSMFPFYAKRK